MDVALLGTSLIALGDVCVEANSILNGQNATVKVLITADVRANCVSLDLSVVQNVMAHVQTLLTNANVVSAKDLLEWIGILKTGTVAGIFQLLPYLKWRKEHKGQEIHIQQGDNGNVVIINASGDNSKINVPMAVYKLSKSPKLVESVKQLASPVSEINGIDEAVFIYEKKEQLKIDKALAAQIQGLYADSDDPGPQTFTVRIVVHKAAWLNAEFGLRSAESPKSQGRCGKRPYHTLENSTQPRRKVIGAGVLISRLFVLAYIYCHPCDHFFRSRRRNQQTPMVTRSTKVMRPIIPAILSGFTSNRNALMAFLVSALPADVNQGLSARCSERIQMLRKRTGFLWSCNSMKTSGACGLEYFERDFHGTSPLMPSVMPTSS
jgi:hypothetical protein